MAVENELTLDENEITADELEEIFIAIENVLEPYDKLRGFKLVEIRFEEEQQGAPDEISPTPTPAAEPKLQML